MIIAPVPPPQANSDNNYKEVVFKKCVPFTDYKSKISKLGKIKCKYIYIYIYIYIY